MPQTRPFVYGGRTFFTLGNLKGHLSSVIDAARRPAEEEFFDEVLAEAIADRHYAYRERVERPTSFKFMLNPPEFGRPGTSLALLLVGEWHTFSLKDVCCESDRKRTLKEAFADLCRNRFYNEWRPLLLVGRCNYPGCTEVSRDLDHVQPQHADIVDTCWEGLTLADKEYIEQQLRTAKAAGGRFQLPHGHPITCRYDEETAKGIFQSLCKQHHVQVTAERRRRS